MGAYDNPAVAFAGLKYGLESRVESWRAAEAIDFGAPAFGYEGDDVNAYNAKTDVATVVLSADLVSLNVITNTVNGVEVATTFITDHATTMAAIKTDIEAAIEGAEVTLTDLAGDNRTFQIFIKGENVTVTSVVTLGASQATTTVTLSNNQVFLGVSMSTAKSSVNQAGGYEADETFNVMAEGSIWVNTSVAVSANTDAYVTTTSGANQGKFGTSGYATGGKFRSNLSAAGLALVELRGQKTS